jgi:hypothetical protein
VAVVKTQPAALGLLAVLLLQLDWEFKMSRFAIIENDVVINLAEAESIEIMGLVLPDAELVLEITDATGEPYIGGEYRPDVQKFIPYKSYDSWVWNEESWSWNSPVAYPTDGNMYRWDEEIENWVELAISAEEAV